MQEIWKDIVGYEGLYQVSNLGRVKSLGNTKARKEKILLGVSISDNYLQIGLNKNGERKRYVIHRLVAEAFIPNPLNKPQVNHINGNKKDNSVENLEWCTQCENIRHSIKKHLRGRYVRKIDRIIDYIETKRNNAKNMYCKDILNDIIAFIKE